MLFTIHTASPIPIYEQIETQIIFGIASGALEVGERIPSVRDLADQLVVNPNTVARAFQGLEKKGILEARRGVGMVVAPEAAALCRAKQKEIVRDRIRELVREAATSALSPEDIRRLVEEELSRVHTDGKEARAQRLGKRP
jgi:GntR family transcriptional regulator